MEHEELKHLYCAADGARADTFGTAEGPKTVRCPTCGQSDTFEDAVAEAAKGQIQAMLGGAFKGSSTITVQRSGPSARWRLSE